MDDVALANYVVGLDRGPIEAGRIDAECARLLGVPCGTVIWFSEATLIKLEAKHGEINFSHYHHISSILLRGFLALGRKKTYLDFWWVHSDAVFFVVLKATMKREVYVQTFHRIHMRDGRRLYRRAVERGRLIRVQIDGLKLLNLEG
jgi:hypothetical protein